MTQAGKSFLLTFENQYSGIAVRRGVTFIPAHWGSLHQTKNTISLVDDPFVNIA